MALKEKKKKKELSKRMLSTTIANQKTKLKTLEDQIEQILNNASINNYNEKSFNTSYINLMDKINGFLMQCQELQEQTKNLHLDEYHCQIGSLIRVAINYKNNFPETYDSARQYVEKKDCRLSIINFKIGEKEFINSLEERLNRLLVIAKSLDEQTYYSLVAKLKEEIKMHEQQYKEYYLTAIRNSYNQYIESLNNLYQKLQIKKVTLNTPYYTATQNHQKQYAVRKIMELEKSLSDYNQKLQAIKSLRTKEALSLIEAKIDTEAYLSSLRYYVNNFNRITNEVSERIVIIESEILECDIRSKGMTKEIIRLSKLAKPNTIYPVEKSQQAKLNRKEREIRLEKEKKKRELALLAGEELEIKQRNQLPISNLVLANAKLLKLEKQLLELERIDQIRSDLYLKIKSDYINTVQEVASLKYYDEYHEKAKTPTEQAILTIEQNLAGLQAKAKAVNTEIFRIYGLKSLVNLSVIEALKLHTYELQKASLEKEIRTHKLKLVPLLSKKEEEAYLSSHPAANNIEQELISTEARRSGVNKYLEALESLGFTNSKEYLDAKIETIKLQYHTTRLQYYLEYLPEAVTETDLKTLSLNSEINAHITCAISVESELDRIVKLPSSYNDSNANQTCLKDYINSLIDMH